MKLEDHYNCSHEVWDLIRILIYICSGILYVAEI